MKKFISSIDGNFFVELITGRPQGSHVWLQRLWLAVLFLVGLYLWGYFLNWGRGVTTIHDWAYVSGPRLAFLREAVLRGELPLHVSAPATDRDVTRRFLAVPDQILSPQIFLIPWLDVGKFGLLQFWLMFALGFWALLILRRRFELSLLAFTILFALFNFNGHILTHASVGHITWGGYFLFPLFAVLIFDLLDGQAGWQWMAKVVFLLFLMLLQGSYHQFIWVLFFLGLLAVSVPRHFWLLAKTCVFIVLIAMVRLLPAALLLGKLDNDFIGGYPLAQSIWVYMTQLQTPNDLTITLGLTHSVGTWEYTIFTGLLGAVFIIYFGMVRTIIHQPEPKYFRVLLLPILGLTLLSLDRVYYALRVIFPFPPFTGERVAARFISLAFVFLLVIATVQFQRWMDTHRPSLVITLGMLLLVALGAHDLQRNMFLWSVGSLAYYYPPIEFLPELYFPVNQWGDTPYLVLLAVGLVVSLVSSALLLFLVWRERRNLSTVI